MNKNIGYDKRDYIFLPEEDISIAEKEGETKVKREQESLIEIYDISSEVLDDLKTIREEMCIPIFDISDFNILDVEDYIEVVGDL